MVWCLVAVAIAVVIGRVVVRRDRQKPQHPSVDMPTQKRGRFEAPAGRNGPVHSITSRLLRRR